MPKKAKLLEIYGGGKTKKKRSKRQEQSNVIVSNSTNRLNVSSSAFQNELFCLSANEQVNFVDTAISLEDYAYVDNVSEKAIRENESCLEASAFGPADRFTNKIWKQSLSIYSNTEGNFYSSDDKLEEQLKDRIRPEDPLAHMFTPKEELSVLTNQKKTYDGPLPPANRFGLQPGHRWDGVDRSNGYEKRCIENLNSITATESQKHINMVANF